jgi:hypothetical protein
MKKNNLVYGDIIHMNDTSNDEISFIEIAKILVLRRKLFIGIFLSVFLISLIIAFLKRPTVDSGNGKEFLKYTTYLYIGNLALNYPLEPQYLIEMKIKSIYSDELKNQYPLEIEYEETKMSIMKLVTSLPKVDSNEKTDGIKTIRLNDFIPKGRMAKGVSAISYYKKNPGYVHDFTITDRDFDAIDLKGNIVTYYIIYISIFLFFY